MLISRMMDTHTGGQNPLPSRLGSDELCVFKPRTREKANHAFVLILCTFKQIKVDPARGRQQTEHVLVTVGTS